MLRRFVALEEPSLWLGMVLDGGGIGCGVAVLVRIFGFFCGCQRRADEQIDGGTHSVLLLDPLGKGRSFPDHLTVLWKVRQEELRPLDIASFGFVSCDPVPNTHRIL